MVAALDRLAFWWLRRHYGSVTVLETSGLQWELRNYDKLTGPERS